MRIALFHNLPSGGALRALRDRLACFRKLGHRTVVHVFSTADLDEFGWREFADEVHVEPLDFSGAARYRRYVDKSRLLAAKIRSLKPDLIWVEKCRFFGSPTVLQFLKGHILFYSHEPLRIREHEALADESPGQHASVLKGLWRLPLTEKLLKAAKARDHFIIKRQDRKNLLSALRVFTNSCYSAAWHERVYGLKPEVLYQGVDTDFFKPSSVPREKWVLSVGRIEHLKGHDLLVRALAHIPPEQRPKLIVIGDGSDKKFKLRLVDEARQSGVALEIRERVSDDALREAYQKCALVLCAAIHEPFGLVPLEAMACGKAVLAVREGGLTETIQDGETGWLIERDEAVWASRIQELLADPATLTRAGQAGRGRVLSHWSRGSHMARIADVI